MSQHSESNHPLKALQSRGADDEIEPEPNSGAAIFSPDQSSFGVPRRVHQPAVTARYQLAQELSYEAQRKLSEVLVGLLGQQPVHKSGVLIGERDQLLAHYLVGRLSVGHFAKFCGLLSIVHRAVLVRPRRKKFFQCTPLAQSGQARALPPSVQAFKSHQMQLSMGSRRGDWVAGWIGSFDVYRCFGGGLSGRIKLACSPPAEAKAAPDIADMRMIF